MNLLVTARKCVTGEAINIDKIVKINIRECNGLYHVAVELEGQGQGGDAWTAITNDYLKLSNAKKAFNELIVALRSNTAERWTTRWSQIEDENI